MKKNICLAVSLVFIFLFKYLPIDIGLSADAVQMLGIFIGAVILWLNVGIDWPSVIVLMGLSLLPQASVGQVFSNSFGNSTIAFLIFSFILTYALSETGFLRRCALWFITNKFAEKNIWNFIFMYLISIMLIGSFIAPTVTFLLFFALVKEIYTSLGLKKGSVTAKVMMVSTAIITSVSCAATPIAHTFPLMALGFYEADIGKAISYFEYMKIGIPGAALIFSIYFFMIKLLYSKRMIAENINLNNMSFGAKSKMTKREIIALSVFLAVVGLWILSGVWPKTFVTLAKLGTSYPAMAATALLCFVKVDGKAVLDFKSAVTNGVSWQSIMLCSATLALGKYLTMPEFGITNMFADLITPVMSNAGSVGVLLIIITLSIVLTNLISNIVTTTLMYSIASPVIAALCAMGSNVSLSTVTILIGLCASLAYATPPAIAHVAIAAGSEWTSPKDMLYIGSLTAVVSVGCVLLVCII